MGQAGLGWLGSSGLAAVSWLDCLGWARSGLAGRGWLGWAKPGLAVRGWLCWAGWAKLAEAPGKKAKKST